MIMNYFFFYRSVRTIRMIKNIHRPFWSSLFRVPDVDAKPTDEGAIDQLAENLQEKATIKN